MREPTRRTVDRIVGRAEALTTKIPAAVDALLDQRRRIDGYTPTPPLGVRGTATNTNPEAAAIARVDRVDVFITGIYDELDAALLVLANLERDCDRYIFANTPAVIPPPKPRCDGGINYRGWQIPKTEGGWSSGQDCHNIPAAGKTCDQCEHQASMWARRNPKAPRYEHETQT